MKNTLFSFILSLMMVHFYVQIGSIRNEQVIKSSYGSGQMVVYFNLSGLVNSCNIALEVSFNNSITYSTIPAKYKSKDEYAVVSHNCVNSMEFDNEIRNILI